MLLVLERFGAIGLQLARRGFSGDGPRRLALECAVAFPEVLYLLALWWVRQTLAAFALGELYSPAICRMLERLGLTLASAAFLTVFILPSIARWLGFAPGYVIAYDVSNLVLGALGLSLTIIARVLRSAAAAQAELDEIF
ncbi:MAG: DUF2975 domain-containing protein [Chthoniobacterales bacterium]|nr:DUF2975 domain-containing protein [Chthoniobacterales bacterium]